MSSGFSTVFLQGRIASEPKNKTGYSRFYLDVVERIPDKENEGKWKDRENKILIQLVGKAADKAATLKKNDRVTVAGIFDQMYYEIDAQKRSTLTMKAFRIKKTNTTDPQNLCVVQGHVAFGKDPDTHQRRESSEIKFWDNGQCQVSFSMAVNEWDATEKKDITSWIDVRMKGRRAEKANELLKIGTNIILEGKVITDSWETNGVKHSRTFVETWDFRFVGGKKGDGSDAGGDDYDDDAIPFNEDESGYTPSGGGSNYPPARDNSRPPAHGAPPDLDDEIPF